MKLLYSLDFQRLNQILKKSGKKRAEKFLQKVYTFLYKKASKLTQQNYCRVKCGTCLAGRVNKQESFCCNGCIYLVNNKCSIDALTCRAHICFVVEKYLARTNKKLLNEVAILDRLIRSFNFYVYRGTREDSIKKAMDQLFKPKFNLKFHLKSISIRMGKFSSKTS